MCQVKFDILMKSIFRSLLIYIYIAIYWFLQIFVCSFLSGKEYRTYRNRDGMRRHSLWQATNSSCNGERNNGTESLAPQVPEGIA